MSIIINKTMRLDAAVDILGKMPYFDLATVVQLTEESHPSLVSQLHRWSRAGKLVPLRRGMYTLADRYRRVPVSSATLANALYSPSYLSGLWALGFYGLIPEAVAEYTSVTTRAPRRFENPFGAFHYTNLKRTLFFGYHAVTIAGAEVFIATPEKALLDLFHLTPGEWDRPRMMEMRFQQSAVVDSDRLHAYTQRVARPRIMRAVEAWRECCAAQEPAGVEL